MKAGIYKGIKNVTVETVKNPTCNKEDVVIKVARAGICGTDVGAYLHGGDAVGIFPNNQFGHEFVGTISEKGECVKGFKVGDRVTILPTNRRPVSKKAGCTNTTEIADMSGAFSEYVYVEKAKKDYSVFKLPKELSFDNGVLIEPLAVSTHGVRLARPIKGEKAIVYGAGTIGLCAVSALQKQGIKDIIVSDINNFKLSYAKKLGAKVVNPNEKPLPDFVKEIWGKTVGNCGEEAWNADIVIDCAGAPSITGEFMANAKSNSRLIIVAINMKEAQVSPFWLLAKEVSIHGSRGYLPEDIILSMETLADKKCKLPAIITHKFAHQDFPKAIEQASDGNSAIKVVIEYN